MKAAARTLNRRYAVLALLLALALYVLVPQLGSFQSSWGHLRQADALWVVTAVALTACTYLAGALTYCLLASKPLKYFPTVLVQLAAMFINRLLPAGLGALGANYVYLRHHKHNEGQAATIVAMNNLVGMAGHVILACAALVAYQGHFPAPNYAHLNETLLKASGATVLAIAVLVLFLGKRRFKQQAASVRRQVLSYRYHPWRLIGALFTSMTLTMANVLGLVACCLAVGFYLPFLVIFLIFTFGVSAGTATPTPGGLGGFEAGLTAGFVAFGVPAGTALAAALLFRLISYWLPLGFGAAALIISQRKGYL